MSQDGEHLANEFFQKTKNQAVDFEITLAALLATACLTYPLLNRPWISQIAAFGLLSVTLIRRIAIASPFAPESRIMQYTIPIIEFFTTSSIICLFFVLSRLVSPHVASIRLLGIFSIITIGVSLILIFLQEYAFRDYFVWWAAKFQEKKENSEYFNDLWRDLEMISYWMSLARRNRESWNSIPRNVKSNLPDLTDFEVEPKDYVKLVMRVLLVLGVLYGIPILYSVITIGVSGVFAVMAVIAIHDHSCFWYVAYGNTSYEEFKKPVREIIFWTITYTTLVGFIVNSFSIPWIHPL